MNTLCEGNRPQTAPPASRSWVYQNTVRNTAEERRGQNTLHEPTLLTVLFVVVSCLFSRHYLPSWVPIHTVPAVSPDKIRPERLYQRKCLPFAVLCPMYWHWPMGGTAQMQSAGAVGGRLNWSSKVLDLAGSITVISLLEAGPETTHTEHWQTRMDMEWGKKSGMKKHVPGQCKLWLGDIVRGH